MCPGTDVVNGKQKEEGEIATKQSVRKRSESAANKALTKVPNNGDGLSLKGILAKESLQQRTW